MFTLIFLTLLTNCWSLVPKPMRHASEGQYYSVVLPLNIVQRHTRCFILDDAIKRFAERLQLTQPRILLEHPPHSYVNTLQIELNEPCDETRAILWPTREMNESYSIVVEPGEPIKLHAVQVWGAMHGLETLAQLLHRTTSNELVIAKQMVVDQPRFLHRGFLIDTSRHFLPPSAIKTFIEAMAMVKMNLLHWHIVDTESFPYKSSRFPALSTKGAYDPLLFVYTRNDILEILDYSRRRGIRVMVEFDTPGHAESWGRGYPELLTECFTSGKKYGPINPARRYTYEFLLSLFEEILRIFPDEWIHLGGDEVDFACWKSNPEIQEFMKKKEFGTDYARLQSFFTEQLLEIVQFAKPENRTITPVVWQEVFDTGFTGHKKTIIHVWKDADWKSEMRNVTKAGYNVIFSSCWYLNYIYYGIDWPKFYDCEMTDFGGNEEDIKRVLGGEAAMWGEYVDETNLFSRSWPRGAAVAERLWSVGNLTHKEFAPRLDELRCRMVRRGWPAEPGNGQGFCPK